MMYTLLPKVAIGTLFGILCLEYRYHSLKQHLQIITVRLVLPLLLLELCTSSRWRLFYVMGVILSSA